MSETLRPALAAGRFRSRAHPGGAPAGLVYLRAVAAPTTACLLPVMIAGVAMVLSGRSPLGFLAWSVPAAYALASAWTVFSLKSRAAEVCVRPGEAAVRSTWEVAGRRRLDWQPLTQVRRTRAGVSASIGTAVHELDEEDWPDFESLKETLRAAVADAPA